MDWAGELTDLIQNGNKEAINQAVQGLPTKYNSEFDATILLDKLDHMQTPGPHWAFMSQAAMIATSYAALGPHAPTSSCSNGRFHTHPEAGSKQSGLVEQHSDPDQHHLHLRKTKRTFHGRTPKKGDIF